MTDPQTATETPQEATQEAPETAAAPDQGTPEGSEFKPFYAALPETWRDDVVKGLKLDEGKQNVLGRYESFPKLMEAFFHQRDKIAEGVKASGSMPGEDATEDQWNEWREANGIPAAPDKYELELSDGLVLDDADKAIMEGVFPAAHKNNIPAQAMSEIVDAFLHAREEEQTAMLQRHQLQEQECKEVMREKWGNDYQTNVNMIRGLINKSFPEDVQEDIQNLMLRDGSMAFNNPAVVQAFAYIARQLNPAGAVVPNTSNPGAAVDSEIKQIEATMQNEPDKYWKDMAMQKRYEDLLEARMAMQKRTAA